MDLGSDRYGRLLEKLASEYRQHAPRSADLNRRAKRWLVDGGSHALRLIKPFPPRIARAGGAWVEDVDGHQILDFWQGHYANILGHNPEPITRALSEALRSGNGLQTGFTDALQAECAAILCQQTGSERVRFTTSGSLATMYAMLLARAYTGRDLVMKAGGGWHGAQPWSLKGVTFHAGSGPTDGFQRVETEGLPRHVSQRVVVTRFNDCEALTNDFRRHGDDLACFIVEPFIGVGGFIPALPEYLARARQLTEEYGALLLFDEVIDGFRFRAGDVGRLYGLQPDLATFGKTIGGGMPVSAVGGRAEVMGLVGRGRGQLVKFSGGTYSAHPASMLAAKTMMSYLVAHEEQIYGRLGDLGQKARRTVETAFGAEGIDARCTGYGNQVVPHSSLTMVQFPLDAANRLLTPDDVHDPRVSDVVLREQVLKLALLLEDVHVVHGLGAVSVAHTEADIQLLGDACGRVARRIKSHL